MISSSRLNLPASFDENNEHHHQQPSIHHHARVFYVDLIAAAPIKEPLLLQQKKSGPVTMPAAAPTTTSSMTNTATTAVRFVPVDIMESCSRSSSGVARNSNQNDTAAVVQAAAAVTTWNWCANFVARYNLCPWAAASVQTRDAIRIYCCCGVGESWQRRRIEAVLMAVAQDFRQHLQTADGDPHTAIAFVVLIPPTTTSTSSSSATCWYQDFPTFYEWFVKVEERWNDNDVTLAPFHPEWKYYDDYDDDDDVIELEKQSPYPTISLVSTAVIDKAGPAATEQIARNNQEILQGRTRAEWKLIYETAVSASSSAPKDNGGGGGDDAFEYVVVGVVT